MVLKALTELFVKRDVTAIDRYWGTTYIQHNPLIPNGREHLAEFVKSLGPDFKYEPGMIVAEGDLVMVHGRYTGFGPKPLVAADIFRLKDGKLVEHWDAMQKSPPTRRKAATRCSQSPANNRPHGGLPRTLPS